MQVVAEADAFKGVMGFLNSLAPGHAGNLQAKSSVVKRSALRKQCEGLEDHGHVAATQADQVLAADVLQQTSIDLNLTGCGGDQPIQHPQQS